MKKKLNDYDIKDFNGRNVLNKCLKKAGTILKLIRIYNENIPPSSEESIFPALYPSVMYSWKNQKTIPGHYQLVLTYLLDNIL